MKATTQKNAKPASTNIAPQTSVISGAEHASFRSAHLRPTHRVMVVVAEEVQHAVHGVQHELMVRGMAALHGLPARGLEPNSWLRKATTLTRA